MELTQDGQHVFIDIPVFEDYSKWNLFLNKEQARETLQQEVHIITSSVSFVVA